MVFVTVTKCNWCFFVKVMSCLLNSSAYYSCLCVGFEKGVFRLFDGGCNRITTWKEALNPDNGWPMDFPTRWEYPGSECSIESVLMLGSNVGISLPWWPLQDIEGIQSTESQTIIQLRALICTKYGAKLLATQLSACQTQKPNNAWPWGWAQ